MIRPPALRPGALISLVAPAGPLADGAIERAISRVRAAGWEPQLGPHSANRSGYLAGTDQQRLDDLNAALGSSENDAVWCLRGGYGTMRIIDRVHWIRLAERPRPLIGFSDNTVLHLAAQQTGVVSFHGPHPGATDLPEFSMTALRAVVEQTNPVGILPFPPESAGRAETLMGGAAEGPLVGGNLSLLAATIGTPFQVLSDGAILFFEEVAEPVYRVDRLLSQLRLAGLLDRVAGVAVGAISDCPDAGNSSLPHASEVVLERLRHLGVPVAFGFPFGHVPHNLTLPMGIRARLDADAGSLELLEAAVV